MAENYNSSLVCDLKTCMKMDKIEHVLFRVEGNSEICRFEKNLQWTQEV